MARRSIALGAGSLLVFALLWEAIVRLLAPDLTLPSDPRHFRFSQENTAARPHHVRDDTLGWRLAPNQTAGIRTNSRGYRTPEFEPVNRSGSFRILFAGDSNPLGFDLEDEEAPYPRRVRAILLDYLGEFGPVDSARVEAINVGVDGLSSHQVRRLLEGMLPRLTPDVVCIQVGFNDHCLSTAEDRSHDFSRPGLLNLLERSHAYRWLRRSLLGVFRPSRKRVDPVPRVSLDDYEANMRAIVRRCHAVGALPILVTTPARPAAPLVINEVAVERDGHIEWMTQENWIAERFRALGLDPPYTPAQPQFLPVIREACRAYPDWPLPHYLLAVALRRLGRPDEAKEADEIWRQHDRQRAVLGSYMDRLRRVSEEEHALLVDAGEVLDSYLEEAGGNAPSDLFLDFVHLDKYGHVVVATEIARLIAAVGTERLENATR